MVMGYEDQVDGVRLTEQTVILKSEAVNAYV